MTRPGLVSVTIVTYNSERYIRCCLESVLAQEYPQVEIIVVDNVSTDGTKAVLEAFKDRVKTAYNIDNNGFAGGQNQAIGLSEGEWVLTLNPDMLLEPGFIAALVRAGNADEKIGTVCGKLLRMSPDFVTPKPPVIDSTGIYFTPNLRHLDRGSQQRDDGRYEKFEYIFGATGAAALFRRTMIEDVSIDGEFFDEDFFVYREDADLAWRAQLLGWRCLYTPQAIGYHVRSVLPENRSDVSPLINMHSVKNRFLMRIKNTTGTLYRRFWFPVTVRDALVIGSCCLREFSSLRAFPLIAKLWSRTWEKRRAILAHRRVSDDDIAKWFAVEPVSFPATEVEQKTSVHKRAADA